MLILVYSLCSIAVIKIILDIAGGEFVAIYSVVLENIMFFLILTMIIRVYFKQREGRREMLQKKIHDLNQRLAEMK
jgi:ABC-type transport system involved in cytochrome c biogenesis permease subunit